MNRCGHKEKKSGCLECAHEIILSLRAAQNALKAHLRMRPPNVEVTVAKKRRST